MFKIYSGDEMIALCDQPRYIKLKPSSGCFVQTTQNEAQGIAVHGNPYNLPGHTEITVTKYDEETETTSVVPAPEAIPVEVDSGELIVDAQTKLVENGGKIQAVDESLTDTQIALCEVYEMLAAGGAE